MNILNSDNIIDNAVNTKQSFVPHNTDPAFLDSLMSKLDGMPRQQQMIARSFVWSAANRFCALYTDSCAPQYKEAIPAWMEYSMGEALNVVSAFSRFVPEGQYGINTKEMVDILSKDQAMDFVSDDEAEKETAEVTGRTIKEIRNLMKRDHVQVQKDRAVQKKAMRQRSENIVIQLENAKNTTRTLDAINARGAVLMADKALFKLEDQLDKLTILVSRTRSAFRRRKILADFKLIEDTATWLSKELDRLEYEADQDPVNPDTDAIH